MVAPITDEALRAVAAAIFQPANPLVVEAYSAFDAELCQFNSAKELVGYVLAQRELPGSSAQLAVYYPEMGGGLVQTRIELNPTKCQGHSYRYTATGWGLISVHLSWSESPVGSLISANTQKRARAWASTSPELGSPAEWDWESVGRHLRRLRRVLKLAA
jgi:hypothetical protein